MRKPFARVEKTYTARAKEVCGVLVVGDDVIYSEREFVDNPSAKWSCDRINAAHHAEVKRELEAFKSMIVDSFAETDLLKNAAQKYLMDSIVGVVSKINIDAFMEREEKK
jgi:hypothetical protein